MFSYFIRRLLTAIPVMLVVALSVFLLLRLSPGDPATIIAGDMANPEQVANIRRALGLDEPILTQFLLWIGNLLQGDLGTSLISQTTVSSMIAQRLEPTVSLALAAILITVLIAVPLGVIAAWRQGSWIDNLVMSVSVVGFSVPVFVIAYLLIQVFAIELRWLPVQGFRGLDKGLGEFLSRLILPALTLSSVYIALIARMTRASMLEVLREDYIRTARAKGLSQRVVLFRHALRNAAVPILTVVGAGFAMMVSGVVVTESVFNIPGLGRLIVDAVLARDYPVIQALILLTAGLYVVINLLIDLSYAITDPRIRY
ncbi:peptide/nickel transport system permease protein [Pseudomonas cuatrocienegasensis]|jgi:peptide/nickel transport system permease protein|uniref:Peptide/nickel transport system permease protein n=1 Tax=Pseudomonas cuatrocienegasensis TaxID=543360 RepID=A0ABY1BP69_9PSED|nr:MULTISPECIES: ABC transporter permease [Pseudomonas]OEC34131.1 peptide ABC transporter [Pseudomonas sp. 21C1]SER29808.1 peptide/nickel transport system permease protein [Pseudomonas cuatrocienegasensis]